MFLVSKKSITFYLTCFLFFSNSQFSFAASAPPEEWSPYLGESDIYETSDGARWTNQDMYWRSGSVIEFGATNDTYEHQTLFYNYDNNAWALEDSGYYQTDLPDHYMDTQFLNESSVAGNPGESDITVGTFDPDQINTSTWYYSTVKLKPESSSGSYYKISGQEGYSACPSVGCVNGQTSAIYIPYQKGFTAPEVNRYFKFEWESNNTMDGAADHTELSRWNNGVINTASDIDFWDFEVSSGRYYKFEMDVPKGDSGIDYDLKIYNSSGSLITTLNNSAEVDEKNDVWLGTGNYFVKIYPYKGSSEYNQYSWIFH